MRIAVVGAGIVGVTSAYELAADGHAVTLFERHAGVAVEASFAPAGLIAPGHMAPWSPPRIPLQALRLGLRPSALRWLWRAWRAQRQRVFEANWLRLQRLATFSRARLHQLSHDLELDYERSDGHLVLLRGERDLAQIQPALDALARLGTRMRTLDAAACRQIEPGLNADIALHAGVHLPDDEVANSRQFALLLRAAAQRRGVEFRLATQVHAIGAGPMPTVVSSRVPRDASAAGGVRERASQTFDAVVVCAALDSGALLRPLGVNLPIQPVHGYTVTAPLREDLGAGDTAPRSALTDERHRVDIVRLGQRVRVAGGAELGGAMGGHRAATLRTLYQVLDDWFPGSARAGQAQAWKGTRTMLPDGLPVVGASGVSGVWLNLAHSTSGAALACGCARVLADAIAGRIGTDPIDGLGVERLR